MIKLTDVITKINKLPQNFKTKDIDFIIKEYIKNKDEIEYNFSLLKNNVFLQRIFFYVNLNHIKNHNERLAYIDKYKDVLSSWESTDQLICKINKADFSYAYKYACEYIKNKNIFVNRWAYVMFMTNPAKKDENKVKRLLTLFKNTQEHYIIMGQAWLLCELAVYNPEIIYNYLFICNLKYNILSMAISKINDSFRINDEWKDKFKSLKNHKRNADLA